MKDMPRHPRLMMRGNTYWHRAAIPSDIKETYPKTEETFSLRTKNAYEALIAVRKAAAEVDEKFAAHRRQMAVLSTPPVSELSKAQLDLVEDLYYAHLLDEDEGIRMDGFYEPDEPQPEAPVQSFEDRVASTEEFASGAGFMLARGKSDAFYRAEAEEVLTWDGLEVSLDGNSPSWKAVYRSIQSAIVRAQSAIDARNKGQVIKTPEIAVAAVPTIVSKPLEAGATTAGQARAEWISEKSRSAWVEKTRREHEVWSQHFLNLVGDRPIGSYAKADGRAFKQALQKLPANWNKHKGLVGLSFAEAAKKSGELALPPMSDRNLNKIIGFVGAFWNWAAENYDEVSGNPFDSLKLKIKKSVRDERDPFSLDQLQAIFNSPIYTGCHSEHYWARPGTEVYSSSGRYWVPLISLFSGARMGEIIQLRVDDVRDESGVLHFHLVDEYEDQRLKTANAYRRIPVHPELVRLGLLKLIQSRRDAGEVRLFPDLPMGADGYYSSPFSKFYARFLEAVGVKGTKTAFHSFRHNFEDACRDAEMPAEIMNTLQGHSEKGMAARYGKGYVLPKLDEWVRRVKYDGLDLNHLEARQA